MTAPTPRTRARTRILSSLHQGPRRRRRVHAFAAAARAAVVAFVGDYAEKDPMMMMEALTNIRIHTAGGASLAARRGGTRQPPARARIVRLLTSVRRLRLHRPALTNHVATPRAISFRLLRQPCHTPAKASKATRDRSARAQLPNLTNKALAGSPRPINGCIGSGSCKAPGGPRRRHAIDR